MCHLDKAKVRLSKTEIVVIPNSCKTLRILRLGKVSEAKQLTTSVITTAIDSNEFVGIIKKKKPPLS